MTSEERERLGRVARGHFDGTGDDECWRNVAGAVAGPLLAEIAALRARAEAAESRADRAGRAARMAEDFLTTSEYDRTRGKGPHYDDVMRSIRGAADGNNTGMPDEAAAEMGGGS